MPRLKDRPITLVQLALPNYLERALVQCALDESKKEDAVIKRNEVILSAIVTYLTHIKGYQLKDFYKKGEDGEPEKEE